MTPPLPRHPPPAEKIPFGSYPVVPSAPIEEFQNLNPPKFPTKITEQIPKPHLFKLPKLEPSETTGYEPEGIFSAGGGCRGGDGVVAMCVMAELGLLGDRRTGWSWGRVGAGVGRGLGTGTGWGWGEHKWG
ncbi:uncharacterized protein A4U43_C03F24270 [Asparagus officinalis]|uniref:Uncharacterized protein n=1 Tax=Asparagus officinalis TaxID=4686 RepID=A0A5P1FHL1_ASPOF|nr:uncharacterized protein A4U43_C03F24270 [Asparagus officinalis]